jgi:hypothetical protein
VSQSWELIAFAMRKHFVRFVGLTLTRVDEDEVDVARAVKSGLCLGPTDISTPHTCEGKKWLLAGDMKDHQKLPWQKALWHFVTSQTRAPFLAALGFVAVLHPVVLLPLAQYLVSKFAFLDALWAPENGKSIRILGLGCIIKLPLSIKLESTEDIPL